MSLALLLVGDGRDELHERSWASAQENLPMQMFDYKITVDDSDHKLGFAGAIKTGWEKVLAGGADWVFHLEADFLFNASVDLEAMIGLLAANPELAQMALKRQAVNEEECAAGGIVECHPDDFEEQMAGAYTFTMHRRYWTTNPAVYPTRWCRLGWPQERFSEGVFTHRLLADPLLRFAFWGPKFGDPLVEHIGVRVGVGY